MFRNDKVIVDIIKKLNLVGIIIFLGLGSLKDVGVSIEVVNIFVGSILILGVCFGY